MNRLRGASLALAATLSGCIASNVLAPELRAVVADPAQLVFAPASAGSLGGFYASVDVRGDAAASLRRVWYVFRADGGYTGAALAEGEGRLSFQTLDGTWTLGAGGLVLDGGDPIVCELAGEHVRLTAPNGVVVLRREELP